MEKKLSEQAAEVLKERGAIKACPRCGKKSFTMMDGIFKPVVNPGLGTNIIGGPSVPVAVVVCDHCGFISQHALGALGLLGAGGAE